MTPATTSPRASTTSRALLARGTYGCGEQRPQVQHRQHPAPASWRPRPARRASRGDPGSAGNGRHLGDVGHRDRVARRAQPQQDPRRRRRRCRVRRRRGRTPGRSASSRCPWCDHRPPSGVAEGWAVRRGARGGSATQQMASRVPPEQPPVPGRRGGHHPSSGWPRWAAPTCAGTARPSIRACGARTRSARRCTPPSGGVAGLMARTDALLGVNKAPANEQLRGVLALDPVVDRKRHGELNPVGVNCVVKLEDGEVHHGLAHAER